MGRYAGSEQKWNEFQWEREIRRDERRISCYFRELSDCLDLPGEEGMIFDSLMSRPGLVPAGSAPGRWRMWDSLEPDENDEEAPAEPPRRRPGEELVEQLDKLACEWNVLFALRIRESLRDEGLAVACGFGKLLARLADFVDTDEEAMRGLKLSLGKRALGDLNDLVGMLLAVGQYQPSLQPANTLLIELLQQMRERVIDLLARLRAR